MEHTPVLVAEVLSFLPRDCALLVDATLGLGGHAAAYLDSDREGRVLGMDRDSEVLAEARKRLEGYGGRLSTAHAPFSRIAEAASPFPAPDAVLFDFGVSSVQLDDPARGFSFREDAPLDMRMDRSAGETAAELVARLPEKELADLIYELGGERTSRRVARRIVEERRRAPIETTGRLADVVRKAVGRRGRIDSATRTFQALRMAVNDEPAEIEAGLQGAIQILRPGGRLLAISFHSGEDRSVKWTFRSDSRLDVVTRKPVRAGEEERRANPRSRSAKLRVAEKRESDA